MLKFVFRRVLIMIPVIMGITFIVYGIMTMAPGDPVHIIAGTDASETDIERIREEYGLDNIFVTRYFNYIKGVVKGDLGKSWRTKNDVAKDILARLPCTLLLTLGSASVVILIGIPAGVISAVKQYSLVDNFTVTIALMLTSIPGFWLGLMLMLVFALKLRWLPSSGIENMSSYILPCITAGTTQMAAVLRMSRSAMLEVIRQDYVRTARAKGAKESKVIIRHAFRNAQLSIVTSVGLALGVLIGGAVITETVFNMPGIGTLLVSSVRNLDVPTVMGTILFIAISIGVINLLVDIIYAYIDPRIKAQYIRK